MTSLYTTFQLAREADACRSEYKKVARALGGVKKYGQDTPIPLTVVLEHTSINSASWALRCVPQEQASERDKIARLFACACARRVLHFFEKLNPEDMRPRQAIETAEKFAYGNISIDKLIAAHAAADAAAYADAYLRIRLEAVYAAYAAAYAAHVAADAAAYAAADAAAYAVASAAERVEQSRLFMELLENGKINE